MPTVGSVADRIHREGEPVSLLRKLDDGVTLLNAPVTAFVRHYKPEEIGGGIQQGDRELHIAPGDLAAQGWTDRPRKPDQVTIGTDLAIVQSAEMRRLRGLDCMLVVQVRGG